MTAFLNYWNAYPNEAEASRPGKTSWSDEAVAAGIIRRASEGLAALLDERLTPAALDLLELADGVLLVSPEVQFRNTRVRILAMEAADGATTELRKLITDTAREALCCCVLPSTDEQVWPVLGHEQSFGAGSVIPFYPADVDALAKAEVEFADLIEFKLHRRLVLDKSDAATQFDKRIVRAFLDYHRSFAESALDLEHGLPGGLKDDSKSWIDHPLSAKVRDAVDRGRPCLLVGPSSSGKSVLALQVGQSMSLAGHAVAYINFSQMGRLPSPLFDAMYGWSSGEKLALVILDDLQSNPAVARMALAVASAAYRCSTIDPPVVLAVSWVDFSKSAAAWFHNCLPVAVRSFQVRDRLVSRYRGHLGHDEVERIAGIFGDDLFLLRLSLEQSAAKNRLVEPADLAEHVWKERIRGSDVDQSEASRAALVVGSLGRFDIPTPPLFLKAEARLLEDTVDGLLDAGVVRWHGSNLSMGHRSLSGLLADWLAANGGWQDMDRIGGPRTTGDLVLDYLRSLGSSLAVDSLRALHARAGFKDRPRLNRRAAALVELWEAFNAVLERIEHQQAADPTWGCVPSSAMFALAAFAEVGKVERASESLDFLRSHWDVDADGISVVTAGLATSDDFVQIKQTMSEEDKSGDTPPPGQAADDVDADLFHRTWVLGLILGAEAMSGAPRIALEDLGRLVEAEQLRTGAFYPERVAWSTARVLLGLAGCGRTVDTSSAVSRAVDWLLRDRASGGASSGGLWHSGTGRWNSTLETTGMVLLALAAVGYDCSDPRLDGARAYLFSQRNRWVAPGSELDGALAIQAFLDTGGSWEEVAPEAQKLSQWAKSEALWQNATRSAKESLDQSCRVAQIASHLVSIGWTAIRSDLPGFLDALATPDLLNQSAAAPSGTESVEERLPEAFVESGEDDLELEVVLTLDRISLMECTVVGAYRRFEERTRNQLRDWKTRIQQPLRSPNQAHENFLIWAAPGSGKSFFVQEIAGELGDPIDYFELNLARCTRERFSEGLDAVRSASKALLCLLDEIDARADESWPYEECFSLLDLNLEPNRAAVFVLIGSAASGMAGMVRSMGSRQKGQDLLDRVPVGHRFEIPQLELEDRAVIVASQVLEAAAGRGQIVREIERLALYYALKSRDLQSPRQLRDLAVSAIQRVASDDNRLKYDDLFHRGDSRNQEFWVDHSEAAAGLSNTFTRIDP